MLLAPAMMLLMLLAPQRALPTAPMSTWDGVPGSEVIHTDPETGETTYPMGQQPEDALSQGCVFGRSNVRCPRPSDISGYGRRVMERNAARAAATRADAAARPATRLDLRDLDFTTGTEGMQAGTIDCVMEDPQPGQSRCTFDEAMTNHYLTGSPRQVPQPDEVEPDRTPNNGCRRVETRNPDGSGWSVSMRCSSSSGSPEALEQLRRSGY